MTTAPPAPSVRPAQAATHSSPYGGPTGAGSATRGWNFSSGPAMLPEPVLRQAADEMLDWQGTGQSVMEMSHRSEAFQSIHHRAQANLRKLMAIPESHHVLFLQGGATLQFAILPMNLLPAGHSADHVITGVWSQKAAAEAARFGHSRIVATSEADRFTTIPDVSHWQRSADAAYLHYCANETIHGVEFAHTPDAQGVPLIGDVSSNILSRPLDVAAHAVLYAGAQKNMGPAGLTVVIIDDAMLGRLPQGMPSLLDLRAQVAADSMVNTPSTYAIYLAGLTFQWLLARGGVAAIEQDNIAKADLLYRALDASPFFRTPVSQPFRSRMNVPFTLPDVRLEAPFLAGAAERGLMNLQGHRSVGGMRASIYNAMPLAGVQALVDWLAEFERTHG